MIKSRRHLTDERFDELCEQWAGACHAFSIHPAIPKELQDLLGRMSAAISPEIPTFPMSARYAGGFYPALQVVERDLFKLSGKRPRRKKP